MRIFPFILALIIGVSSYADENKKFTYQMIYPVQSVNMEFSDSTMNVSFEITETSILFKIKNHSNHSFYINWDECSLVKYEKAERIINSNTSYANKDLPQINTLVPPESYVTSAVVPIDQIYYLSNLGWRIHPLFFAAKIHETLTLFLSIGKKEYKFVFEVTGVIG